MKFFKRFFKGDKKESEPDNSVSGADGVRLVTNAPDAWPDVFMPDYLLEEDSEANTWAAGISVATGLKEGFDKLGLKARLIGLEYLLLLEDGVLEAPLAVEYEGVKHLVYVYPRVCSESSAVFAGISSALKERSDFGPPIYFASEKLVSADAKNPMLIPMSFKFLSRNNVGVPKGQYALWWPTPGEDYFAKSKTLTHIDRAYRAFDGIESYAHAELIRSIDPGLEEKKIDLPSDFTLLLRTGPENTPLIVDLSQEKGIRFCFHTATTDPGYRDLFWKNIADYAENLRQEILDNNLPIESDKDPNPLGWWTTLRAHVIETGTTEKTLGVGVVSI